MHSTTLLALLALAGACGCVLDRQDVGDTLPATASDGADPSGADSTADSTADPTADAPTSGAAEPAPTTAAPEDGAFGSLCSFTVDGAPYLPDQRLVTANDACAGGICLYAEGDVVRSCDGPEDCGPPSRVELPICEVDGRCALDEAYVAAHSLCTQTCEVDADCPDAPACAGGFFCAPIARLGPLCCTKVCACRDLIGPDELVEVVEDCADGCGN